MSPHTYNALLAVTMPPNGIIRLNLSSSAPFTMFASTFGSLDYVSTSCARMTDPYQGSTGYIFFKGRPNAGVRSFSPNLTVIKFLIFALEHDGFCQSGLRRVLHSRRPCPWGLSLLLCTFLCSITLCPHPAFSLH